MKTNASLFIALAAACAVAHAAETTVNLSLATQSGPGAAVGSVRIVETRYGLVFYPDMRGLPAGVHGFHVHENPSCGAAVAPAPASGVASAPAPALAAGGHLDPAGTKKHGEPWGDGHLGDLPPLIVAADGSAKQPVLAPRIASLAMVANSSLMVHAGGDNHADHPEMLGGGGGRIACGVIGG